MNKYPFFLKYMPDTECSLKRFNSYKGGHKIKYQEYIPNSIGAKLVYTDDRFTLTSIIFKGKDCINIFITWVLHKQKWTQQISKQYFNKRLIMTKEDEEIHNNSHKRWIWKQELNMDKVREHCHVTDSFRGSAHNKCNIYDGHIILKELNNFDLDVDVILKGIVRT